MKNLGLYNDALDVPRKQDVDAVQSQVDALSEKLVQPDWSQNDETAPDYVKNRMGGYFQSVLLDIPYDGNQDGKTVIDIGGGRQLVKVADVTGLEEDYVESGAFLTVSGLTQYCSAESFDVYITFGNTIIVFEPTTIREIEFDEPGVYFAQMGKFFVERLVVGNNIVQIGSDLLDLSNIQREVTNTSNVANNALSTADTAKTTAETAKTTADTAKTTAETAKTTADAAVKGSKIGDRMSYRLVDEKDQTDRVSTLFGYSGGSALEIKVTKASASVPPTLTFSPPVFLLNQADFAFTRSTPTYPHPKITEIGGIVMYASDDASKKFLITVNSSGTLSATEVTS